MRRAVGNAIAVGLFLIGASQANAASLMASRPGLARQLLQQCLKPPSQPGVAQLAAAVGAKPYSEARNKRELKTRTDNSEEVGTGRDQQTTTTITEFRGWDLAGPGAGTLEYQKDRTEIVWVDHASGEAVRPVKNALGKTCRLQAPVANARAIFEMYETLTERGYGLRVSADRRWVDVFMFDPDRFDVELSFVLPAPLAGLAPDPSQQGGRLVLSDAGPRFLDGVNPGIPIVTLTRAALLSGLDQPAEMTFINLEIEPVVQRLDAR